MKIERSDFLVCNVCLKGCDDCRLHEFLTWQDEELGLTYVVCKDCGDHIFQFMEGLRCRTPVTTVNKPGRKPHSQRYSNRPAGLRRR